MPYGDKVGKTRQQVAEETFGVKVIQLDYFTSEFVAEYPSITALCEDYEIPFQTIENAFRAARKRGMLLARSRKHLMAVVKKKDYEEFQRYINGQ